MRTIRSIPLIGCLIAALFAVGPRQAAAKTPLSVYTAFENDDLKTFKEAFEKDNPDITINWVRDSTGVITARLLAEKDNPRADVAWGLSATSLLELDRHGLLQPYSPPGLGKLAPGMRDDRDPARWFGTNGCVCAIVYNEVEGKKRGLRQPTGWKDLADPSYRGQVVMPHPASSGTGLMYVTGWIQQFGEEEAWRFMDALHQNVARYMHSGSAPGVAAARGEYATGLAFEIRASRLKEQGAPIAIVMPSDGLCWELNAFALIAGGKKSEAARKLADWASSPAAMTIYGAARSVVSTPGFAKEMAHVPADVEKRIMKLDFAWMAANRERILAEWERRYGGKADARKN